MMTCIGCEISESTGLNSWLIPSSATGCDELRGSSSLQNSLFFSKAFKELLGVFPVLHCSSSCTVSEKDQQEIPQNQAEGVPRCC